MYHIRTIPSSSQILAFAESLLPHLGGVSEECLAKRCSYESMLCSHLQWKVASHRYWDCTTDTIDMPIEIKKGHASMWFNKVRYAEILLQINDATKQPTLTTVFIYDKIRIKEVLVIETRTLIEYIFGGDKVWAQNIIDDAQRASKNGDTNHNQLGLSKKKMTSLASCVITYNP